MVLLRFLDRLSACAWFAVAPAGMEIIIAMEKPNAMITSSALIFRLEMFLTARVAIPNYFAFLMFLEKKTTRARESDFSRGVIWFTGLCSQKIRDSVPIILRFLTSGRLFFVR